ncbi:ABC transporter permease subunit [Halobacillus salinarum]|uniref:ABC transporter permease subunit n=1 Tax=Halobacillus salinarum TaxID=2932257 RepID=A0ABY4EMU2_9BACI|nr:ABC transporter permease subunit [Halobacillus salinarum]UOQ45297.1 ABC transporter permease subunit [Halobacillus salinarum]
MKIIKFAVYYLLGLAGILFISASPALFTNGSFFELSSYFASLQHLFTQIVQPDQWVYHFKGRPVPLLQYLWEPYTYSMTIFFSGIVLGFILALLLSLGTFFLPNWAKQLVGRLLNVLEAVPDLLLAFCLQLFVVWFYKQTSLLIPFASVGQEKVYMLPIIAIAILPMVSLYKVMLMLIDEEMTKSYVQMAKSKGIEKGDVLNVHILRNVVKSAFYHSKIILWASLSSLLIIEYIFNIHGITDAFIQDFTPIVSAVILFMLFTPFFVLYQGTELFIFNDRSVEQHVDFKMNSFIGQGAVKANKNSWKQVLSEAGAHFKNWKFLLGFTVIGGILVTSIIYTMTADPLIDKYYHIYNDEHRLVSAAPHSPKYVFLGTDSLGFSIFDELLAGAKYTILFAFIIAFLRMFIGFVLAVPFAFFLPNRLQRGIEKLVDGMHFLPQTIIAFILLAPVLSMPPGGFTTTMSERIIYQGFVLTLVVVPLIVTLFGNEMKLIMRQEFVMSTKILGGSSLHLLWKHLLPHLSARMGIVFGQQFIQTLLIFIHLGVFSLFFGGTKLTHGGLMQDPPRSMTYEWSGLIGSAKNSLMTGHWWLIIPALVSFMILILSMQLIVQGIKEVQQKRVGVPVEHTNWLKRLLPQRSKPGVQPHTPKEGDFVFTHSERSNTL